MTSSNGNIFRVTGRLCGEFTGPGEFPTQRPVTRSFDVFFDLRPNKPRNKQSWGWWFETLSRSLWRHRNVCHNFQWHLYYQTASLTTHYTRPLCTYTWFQCIACMTPNRQFLCIVDVSCSNKLELSFTWLDLMAVINTALVSGDSKRVVLNKIFDSKRIVLNKMFLLSPPM